jgi:hypothetical protein
VNEEAIARGRADLEAELREQQREEEAAIRKATQSEAMRSLDKQQADPSALNLDPAEEDAARAALERKREELRALATGSIAQRMSRAQHLLSRMPAIVNTYRELIEGAMKALTDPRRVFAAREAIRPLLVGNNILLEPNANHSALVGTVRFVQLGDQILELAGAKRTVRHRSCRKRDQRSQSLTTDSLIARGPGSITAAPAIMREVRND